QALVTGTDFLVFFFVHAHGDVRALFADGVEHRTAGAVEADVGAVVADVQDHLAHHVFQIDIGGGGDFARDHGHAGLHQGFHRHARVRIILDDGVEHGIRNLVGHFVRVAFGYGFRRKDGIFAHCLGGSLVEGFTE